MKRRRRIYKSSRFLKQSGGGFAALARAASRLVPVVIKAAPTIARAIPKIAKIVTKPVSKAIDVVKPIYHKVFRERYSGPSRQLIKWNKRDLIGPLDMVAHWIDPALKIKDLTTKKALIQ